MVFSSVTFLLLFLPAFLIIYQLIGKAFKNAFILISSIVFYSWGAPTFIFILLGTTFIDFFIVKKIDKVQLEWKRKALLMLSLSINVGLLYYFKYAHFFIENVNLIITQFNGKPFPLTEIILPIGISFYTFETITYVVDVYRKVHKPLHKFWDYQLYIILFPKLIAGPIVRFHTIADQINQRDETIDDKLHGFIRFCLGLSKKIILANTLGEQADKIFSIPMVELSGLDAWIGIIAYTFQIYFDFSGYSDMAIGLCRMMGFKIPENFETPYCSGSITEFWRRWHISLGQWMKNYLYIPLGGNRSNSKWKVLFNLWIVFLISGLWHGASWNFVIWGIYHGLFLILDRLFLLKLLNKTGKIPSVIITFLIVVNGWVFFRIETFANAIAYLQRMWTFTLSTDVGFIHEKAIFIFILSAFLSFIGISTWGKKIESYFYNGTIKLSWYIPMLMVALLLYVLSLSMLTTSGFNPFIYFRF